MSSILKKMYVVEMPNGEKWGVPVRVIAENRAAYYAEQDKDEPYFGDPAKSLEMDTVPLFESDEYEIHDWAANNMNWDDVKDKAARMPHLEAKDGMDWQEGWCNGEHEIADAPEGGDRNAEK